MKPTQAGLEQANQDLAGRPGGAGRVAMAESRRRRASRGQVLVIFAGGLIALLSLSAVVIDVSWYWANTLRVQRAADAAALAAIAATNAA